MSEVPKNFKRYTVTSALPYANGPLHLGHISGAYLPADIYVRYLRSIGKDVLYICGTDEHGAAIGIKAKKENTTPQAVVDEYYQVIEKAFRDFNISFDVFSRTSKEIHHKTAQEFFLKFYNEGKFIEKVTEQLFDQEAQMFLADRYVKGTCPKCSHPSADGDQCEKCGSALNATDLIDPKSTITGSVPIMKETRHWFLPLDDYQDRLEKYILEDHSDWKSNVYGQCKSWLTEKLRPRAITRDLDWGIEVPVPEGKGKVLYVWFDAPIGYISATKEWEADQKAAGKDASWEDYWKKDPETALIHFIGKDNIVFHCLIFPAILMGHGEYNLPENVPANEFLNLEGEKLSTSRGHAVWLHEFLEDFPGKGDVMRYALTATMPETKDNDFTWNDFQARNDNELAAILGNYINRVFVLVNKYYEGALPDVDLGDSQNELLKAAREKVENVGNSIMLYRFREALNEAMNIARMGNKYFADTEPWHLIKENPEEVKKVLLASVNLSAILAVVLEPFMPETSARINDMLQVSQSSPKQAATEQLIKGGHVIGKPGILFEKIPDEAIEQQRKKLMDAKELQASTTSEEGPNFPPIKETCTFDDFQKMDIRLGKILEASQVPKADRLLQFKVDIGLEVRTIVSGVAEHYSPEELIGKQVPVLVNLAPRKIRGVESQGMILFAEDLSGKLFSLSPDKEIDAGSSVN